MRILIAITFSLISCSLFAQDKINISFYLVDDATKVSLESCLLKIKTNSTEQKINVYHSKDTIETEVDLNKNIIVKASIIGYDPLQKTIQLSDYKRLVENNKVINIELSFAYEGQSFVEFEVNANKEPSVVFSSDTLSVSDFKIINEDNLILLTYPKRLQKSSEIIWLQNDTVAGRVDCPAEAIELIADYRNNIYLSCKNNTYKIARNAGLKIHEVNTKDLENYIFPILDTLEEERVFFSNYNEWYPAFDYFMVTTTDTQYTTVRHIVDDEMMEHYRAEYKWADVRTKLWAWNMEAESGIDREVWVGANVFTNTIYYEEPYSPMFLVDEELVLFDNYNDQICRIDAYNCEVFDSIPMEFHKNRRKTGWEREIIQDQITKKIYTIYDNVGNTTLREINHETGELSKEIPLFYRYTEHVTVYDNKIYYIYRPFESMQKKYLYVQDLDLVSED